MSEIAAAQPPQGGPSGESAGRAQSAFDRAGRRTVPAGLRSALALLRTQRLVVALAGIVILALWALLGFALESMRTTHLQKALVEAKNIARAFDEGISRDIRYIDSILRVARNEYEMRGYDALVRLLERERFDTALIDHIGVDDAAGNLQFLTSGPVRGPVNVADRDYFQVHRQGAHPDLFIGVPAKGRATGRWLVRASHALRRWDGQFDGVIKAAIDPYHLARLYESFSLGPHGTVMLVGLDRILRSERGLTTGSLGRDMTDELPWDVIAAAPRGSFVADAKDGAGGRRHYVYCLLEEAPLLVAVGIAEQDVVERLVWPKSYVIGLVGLGTAAIAGFTLLLLRQIRSRAQLGAANRELEHAYRAKSDFLSKMSHELRTPLNAIMGFSEIIKTQVFGPVGGERYLAYADAIHSSGQHLLDLINDILEMSKIEANKLMLEERRMGIRATIEWCTSLLQEQAARGQVRITVSLAPDVQVLHADERAVRQVLLNVLGNALKFTGPGGRIAVEAEISPAGELVVTIADTGVGMAPDVLQFALTPFGRGSNLKTSREQGTGLGLPISKALMERHGGELALHSEPGRGTTVILRFPATRVLPFEPPEAAPANESVPALAIERGRQAANG